jgi:hypothetical protein
MESGAFAAWIIQPWDWAEETWGEFAKSSGCKKQGTVDWACVEKLPAEQVMALIPDDASFGPTIDGVEMLVPPWEAVAAQNVAPGVAVLVGSTREDSDAGPDASSTEKDFEQFVRTELEGGGYAGAPPKGVNASLLASIKSLYAADKSDRGPTHASAHEGYSRWYFLAKV